MKKVVPYNTFSSSYKETIKIKIFYWESCRLSATYDLWLKAESWVLNFKFSIKQFLKWFKIQQMDKIVSWGLNYFIEG